jgi:hypothetical protein
MIPPTSLLSGIFEGLILWPLRSGRRHMPPIKNLIPLKVKVPTVLLAKDWATKAAPQTRDARSSSSELCICCDLILAITIPIIAEKKLFM